MRHSAAINHQLPGRVRVGLPALKGDAQGLGQVVETLRRCPYVAGVTANPLLGTLLIRHTGAWSELAVWVESEGVLAWADPARESASQRLGRGLHGLAQGLDRISGQHVDLREWLTVGLIGLAIHQAIKGEVMVPAASLLWYAYTNSRLPGGALPGHAETQQQA